MLLFRLGLDTEKLRKFPVEMWDEEPTQRWIELCNKLQDYHPEVKPLVIKNVSRKWELVSAYQKSVRRGLKDRAMWLVTGFLSFEKKEWAYFWKRICTTVCEDVGYGDPELMNFVIACSTIYRGSTADMAPILKRVWVFLTEQMCDTKRSRVYCQLSTIEGCVRKGEIPAGLSVWEQQVVDTIKLPSLTATKAAWSVKNDWRGEGMLKFQSNFDMELETTPINHIEMHSILSGLPDFCYDVHTRVGKVVCVRLVGFPGIKELVVSSFDKVKTVGMALFFVEGGIVQGGLDDSKLSVLEAKFYARSLGVSLDAWGKLKDLVLGLVVTGVVNDIRRSVLARQGYLKETYNENYVING